jgi:hypothetical protein
MSAPFVAINGQSFATFDEWVRRATQRLTSHPLYNNTEHANGKGWHGDHFVAMCFDQKGRRCKVGADMMRARDEDAFPVWWVWPDQIVQFIMADLPAPAGPKVDK